MVVLVVVVGTGPERHYIVQRPWEFVARVGIDGLQESQGDPHANGEKMQVFGDKTPHHRDPDGTDSQQHDFDGMSVLSGHAEWRSISVVLFVDVLVKDSIVQPTMEPVVPSVLEHEKEPELEKNVTQRREGDLEADSNLLTDGMEEPDGESLHQEMRRQHRLEAFPLFLRRGQLLLLDLVLLEVWDLADDEPWQTSTEVDQLVCEEEQQTCGKQVVVHVVVVRPPDLFDGMQVRELVEVVVDTRPIGGVVERRVIVIYATGHLLS